MLKYWLFYISVNLKFHYVRVAKMLAYYALKKLNRCAASGVNSVAGIINQYIY
ncbi:hypothetical protein C048_03136 [Brucella melitensis UK19/04]|nr:hypothetical protein C048_03136 [Brucella melitensis UK19/04]ENS68834.1 hypothetical protein C034_02860 [Brucella melitensis UK14/06]ENS73909.1 hypothetical protein C059_03129 [Brucella melitensis UK23/06]